jgi:hypothetical protein
MTLIRYPIGPSSYHDGTPTTPRGKMQYVTSVAVALQVRSAAVEFDRDVLKGNGEHLTPNEGVRELDRQEDLYDLYLHHGGALAATPGYSTHDPSIGTAIDFGITRADGTNRALTNAEFSALYAILARRGIVHTGANFARYEAWHCNGGYPPALPPITGVPVMGAPADKPSPPKPSKGRKRMYIVKIIGVGHLLITGSGTYKFDYLTVSKKQVSGTEQIALMQRVIDSNQSDVLNSASEFNAQQGAIISAIMKKVK